MLHPNTRKIKEKVVKSLNLKRNWIMRDQQEILVKYYVKEYFQKWWAKIL